MVAEQLIDELKQESVKTRHLLERLPEKKLSWKPHPKSLTLGQLAWHIAVLPRGIADLATQLNAELPDVPRPQPASVAEVLSELDDSIAYASGKISAWGDKGLQQTWTLTFEGRKMFEMPRAALIRSIMLNHGYHHRGEMMVYLRLLDVPLPPIFGPTADENLFTSTRK
jgi:uncharacterized damage-inducible protein DinB